MGGISSALILPTERPTTTVDVKRALLLFDRVNIFDPDERDLIAPSAFMSAMGMPFVSLGAGAVAPLGKIRGHDDTLSQTLDECATAIKQGYIQVLTAHDPLAGKIAIGNPPPPTGWPPARWAFWNFRRLASSPDYLEAACKGIPRGRELLACDESELAPGGQGLGTINGAALASLWDPGVPEDVARLVSRLAAARIGSAVKTLGMSTLMGLQPFTSDAGMANVLEKIQEDATSTLREVLRDEEDDTRILRRACRVEQLLFDQRLPDAALDSLSFSEVVKLRTKAWGRAGEARADFLDAVRRLSREVSSDEDFSRRCQAEIAAYESAAADLRHEWGNNALVYGSWALGAAVVQDAGLLEQYAGLPSWAIAVGLALAAVQQAGPNIRDLWRKEREANASLGRALVTPYKKVV